MPQPLGSFILVPQIFKFVSVCCSEINCLQVSNPLAEDNSTGMKGKVNNETKRRFSEQLRDEGQSFRAVFDQRRQCIGVFDNGDDE